MEAPLFQVVIAYETGIKRRSRLLSQAEALATQVQWRAEEARLGRYPSIKILPVGDAIAADDETFVPLETAHA